MYRNMRYGLIVLIIGSLLSTSYAQQSVQVEIDNIPDWVNVVTSEIPVEQASGSVRYHLYNVQINDSLEKKHTYYQTIYEPLNKQGVENVSELNFSFYPAYEDFILHDITVIRNGKSYSRLDKEKIKLFQSENELGNKIYSEKWNALFILEDIRPNDIIKYSYTIKGHNPIFTRHDFDSLHLQWGIPVDQVYILVKAKNKIKYQFSNVEHSVEKTFNKGVYDYVIDIKNIEAGPNENQYPIWYEPFNVFQYSAFKSWKDVNEWATKLYDIDYSLPDEFIDKINNWKAEFGKKETISKIIEFVQDDIRYFGIELGVNSHLPRTPKEILKKRYGDCKDKSVLLTAMLKLIGINAKPALVSAKRGKGIVDDLPSPFSFDHVISHFSYENNEYWIDGTATSQRGGLEKRGFINYDYSLVLNSDEKKLHKIQTTFSELDAFNEYSEESFEINPGMNTAKLITTSIFKGLKAESLRRFFSRGTVKSINSNLINYYSSFYPNITRFNDAEIKDEEDVNQVVLKENYDIKKFGSLVSSRKIFKIYSPVVSSYLFKPDKITRVTPISLNHPVKLIHKIKASIKGDILWNDDLENLVIKNKWFDFSRKAIKIDNKFNITLNYRSLSDYVESSDVSQYLDALNEIEHALTFSFWAKGFKDENSQAKKNMKDLIKSLIKKPKAG